MQTECLKHTTTECIFKVIHVSDLEIISLFWEQNLLASNADSTVQFSYWFSLTREKVQGCLCCGLCSSLRLNTSNDPNDGKKAKIA